MNGSVERAVADSWLHLSPPTAQELSSLKVASDEGVEIRTAVDALGRRHLLVRGEAPAQFKADTGVLSTRIRPLVFGGTSAAYLDIRCEADELNGEFAEVAAEIAASAAEAQHPIEDALAAIERWRRLLRLTRAGSLDERQRRGLWAELHVLQALAAPAVEWVGPLGSAHDLELTDRCVEVKAIGGTSETVVIHGLEQLAEHDEKSLLLVLVDVRRDDAGRSLSELVDSLEKEIDDALILRKRLAAARFDASNEAHVIERYVADGVWIIDVSAGTPRITPAELSPPQLATEIMAVRYEIPVASLLHLASPTTPQALRGALS